MDFWLRVILALSAEFVCFLPLLLFFLDYFCPPLAAVCFLSLLCAFLAVHLWVVVVIFTDFAAGAAGAAVGCER